MSRRIVALDVETTGLDPAVDRIIQLAVVSSQDGHVEEWDQLMNPGFPISAEITELTNITNDMLIDAPAEEEVMPKLAALLSGDVVLVAHNLPFDLKFANATLKRYGYPEYTGEFIDTLSLSRQLFPGVSNKLGEVAERLGVKLEHAHNALADTQACFRLLEPLTTLGEAKGIAYRNVLTQFDAYPLDVIPEGTQVITIWTLPWNVSEDEFVAKPPKPFSYKPNAKTPYHINPDSGWMTVGSAYFQWSRDKRREVVLNTNAQRLIDVMNKDGSLKALALSGAMGPFDGQQGRLLQGFEGARTPVEFVRKAYWAIHVHPAPFKGQHTLAYEYLAIKMLQTKVYNPKHVWRDFAEKSLPALAIPEPAPAAAPAPAPKANAASEPVHIPGVLKMPTAIRDQIHEHLLPHVKAMKASPAQEYDGTLAVFPGFADHVGSVLQSLSVSLERPLTIKEQSSVSVAFHFGAKSAVIPTTAVQSPVSAAITKAVKEVPVVPPVALSPVAKPVASVSGSKVVCFDFDGVLSDYKGWTGEWHTEPPIPGAREFVQRLVDAGHKPVIHCSRPAGVVTAWLEQYGFPVVQVVAQKPVAAMYIDYRGFRFTGKNWVEARDSVTQKGWAWSKPSEEYLKKAKEKEKQLKKLAKEQHQTWFKGVVCLAFDGVVSDSEGHGESGAPIPYAKDFVEGMIRSEYEPVIYTHREVAVVESWLKLHDFPTMRVLNAKQWEKDQADQSVRNNKIKVFIELNGFRFIGNNWDQAWEIIESGELKPGCVKNGPYKTPNRLLFVDTETTGLSRIRNRITQLGAILIEDGKVVHEINTYVHPEGGDVSLEALEKTGIVVENGQVIGVKDETTGTVTQVLALSQKEALSQVRALLTSGTTLVCHNVPFDLGMLTASFKREGLEDWAGEFICTLGMWRWLEKRRFDAELEEARFKVAQGLPDAYAAVRPMESGKLFNVCGLLGIPFDEEACAHDALYDVRATVAIFAELRPRWEAIPFDSRNFFAQLRNVKADWIPPGAELITISTAMPDDMKVAKKAKGPTQPVTATQSDPEPQPKPTPVAIEEEKSAALGSLWSKAMSITADISQAIAAVAAPIVEQVKAAEPPKTKPISVSLLSRSQIENRLRQAKFIQVTSIEQDGDDYRVKVVEDYAWAAEHVLVQRKFEKVEDLFKKVSHGLTGLDTITWTEQTLTSLGYSFFKGYDLVRDEHGENEHEEYYFLVKGHLRQTIRTKLTSQSVAEQDARKQKQPVTV